MDYAKAPSNVFGMRLRNVASTDSGATAHSHWKTGSFSVHWNNLWHGPVGQLRQLAVVALAVVFVGACAQSNVWDARMGATGLAAEDAITIVLVAHNYSPYPPRGGYSSRVGFAPKLEQKVGRCISRALRDMFPTLRVVAPDEFRRMAFPNRAPEDVPPRPWEQLMN